MRRLTQDSQIGHTNITSRLTTVHIIYRRYVHKIVLYVRSDIGDSISKGGKSLVRCNYSVVRGPRIRLDLLQEHDVWCVQVADNVVCHFLDVARSRRHVLYLRKFK
jgi:hypothetical protein